MYRRKAPRGSHLGAALLGLGTAVALMKQRGARMRPLPTTVTLPALLATLLALSLTLAPRAEAFVYWTNLVSPPCDQSCTGPPAIGRANPDGTGVSQRFMELGATPTGVAVDAGHIYWASETGAIGRADLDGTDVDESFINTGTHVSGGARIAVDAAHLYWSDANGIGRASVNGSNVEPDFITTAQSPAGVAVDAQYIYWASRASGGPTAATAAIGRANLDGTGVDESFIVTGWRDAVAVDADHLYWTSGPGIGRADLDGTDVDKFFIDVWETHAVAVDPAHVYWTGSYIGLHPGQVRSWIGRANLDGTGIVGGFPDDTALINAHYANGTGLAVDSLVDTTLAGSATATKAQKQHGNAIVVRVKVSADERLTAKTSGKIKVNPTYKLKPKQLELTAGEAITLKLKPKKAQTRKIAAALEQGGSATAKLKVKLSDFAGNSEVEKLSVTLKR